MKRYDVTMRHIFDDGMWEEWVATVSADDEQAALSKYLRRRSSARYLLDARGRFRFRVEAL